MGDGLTFVGSVPVTLTVLSEQPSLEQSLQMDAKNLSLLRMMSVTDQTSRDMDAELEGMLVEVNKLDQKLTLVQELLTQLLMQYEVIPPRNKIELGLSSLSITLSADVSVSVGAIVLAELYLFEDIPRALRLAGTTSSVRAINSYESEVGIALSGFSDGVDSLLGRFIFSQHRRAIAMSRAQNSED